MRRVLRKSGQLGKTNGNLIEAHGMDAVETPLLVEKFCAPKPISGKRCDGPALTPRPLSDAV